MGGGRPVGWPPFHFALVSKTKSARLKVPSWRADLSHTGTCGVILRSEPLQQQPDRTISAVACEPRLQAWPGLDGATISPGGAFAGYVVVRPRKDVGQSVLV
jgi:hypothetical protein